MRSSVRWFAARFLGKGVVLAASFVISLSPALAEANKNAETSALKTPTPTVPASAPGAASQGTLPNGATALSETYSDWQVICALQDNIRRCVAKQEQVNQQSHQMVLAVELTPVDDKVEGVALLPFGLALDSGVTLQIDDSPATTPLRFKTCVPGGCVVALSFDSRALPALRAGTTMKAKVMIEGGTEATLNISLKGLPAALDRTAALLADRIVSVKK
jgi:invasion protein IalB